MSTTVQEQLDRLAKRKAQLAAQERKLRAQLHAKQRKERNSRLIRISAEVFAWLDREPEEIDVIRMQRFLQAYPDMFRAMMNADIEAVTEQELQLVRGEAKEHLSMQQTTPQPNPDAYPSSYAFEV